MSWIVPRGSREAITRRVAWITTLTVALASAVAAPTVLALLALLEGPRTTPLSAPACAGAISTSVLAAHVAWKALGARRAGESAIARSVVAGLLNVPATAIVLGLIDAVTTPRSMASADPAMIPVGLLVITAIGSPLGFGLGAAFGIAIAPLASLARAMILSGDLGATGRARIACGAWLACVGALLVLAGWPMHEGTRRALEWTGGPIALVAIGALVAAWGAAREIARRRWLARVRRGEIAGVAVVPRTTASDEGLLAWDGSGSEASAIVRVETRGAGAYRTSVIADAIALV